MPNDGISIDGDYTIQTLGSVNIQAAGDYLLLNAMGSELTGGYLALNSGSMTSICCGAGMFVMTTNEEGESALAFSTSEEGSISLSAGTEEEAGCLGISATQVGLVQGAPEVGPRLVMQESSMITLAVGPEGAGASLEMTPESITLQVAEWMLSITPEGITLEVGPCMLAVTPEEISINGVSITIEAITEVMLSGLSAQLSGEGTVQIDGPLVMIG